MAELRLRSIAFSVAALVLPLCAQTNVAVIPLDAKGVSEIEASVLTERLALELFRTGRFTVLERGKMEEILTEQDFQLTGCVSEECLVEVGQLLGVEQMMAGSVSRIGETYSVILRLISAESGAIVQVASYDHRGAIDELLSAGMRVVALSIAGEPVEAERPQIPAANQGFLSKDTPITSTASRRVTKGVKVGFNISKIRGAQFELHSVGGQVGFTLGGFINYPLLPYLALGFELLYSEKGFSYEGAIQLNYFDIPALVIFSYDDRASFYIGPYLGFFTQGYTYVDAETISMPSDEVVNLDYGIVFGASYSIRKFIFEARYSAGLSTVFTRSTIKSYGTVEDLDKSNNIVTQILLGYSL